MSRSPLAARGVALAGLLLLLPSLLGCLPRKEESQAPCLSGLCQSAGGNTGERAWGLHAPSTSAANNTLRYPEGRWVLHATTAPHDVVVVHSQGGERGRWKLSHGRNIRRLERP